MNTKLSAFLTMALFALFHPLRVLAQQSQPLTGQQAPWTWPGPWHMWHGGWGFWWMLPLMMLCMIVLCAVIFYLGHRSGGWHAHGGPFHGMGRSGQGAAWGDPTYTALQILNERFAKGEIQKQEYEEKKTAILSSGKP
jgi:putative membrane protein